MAFSICRQKLISPLLMSASWRTQIYVTFKMHHTPDRASLDTTSASREEQLCFLSSFLGALETLPSLLNSNLITFHNSSCYG